jgi:hypothetical protein
VRTNDWILAILLLVVDTLYNVRLENMLLTSTSHLIQKYLLINYRLHSLNIWISLPSYLQEPYIGRSSTKFYRYYLLWNMYAYKQYNASRGIYKTVGLYENNCLDYGQTHIYSTINFCNKIQCIVSIVIYILLYQNLRALNSIHICQVIYYSFFFKRAPPSS